MTDTPEMVPLEDQIGALNDYLAACARVRTGRDSPLTQWNDRAMQAARETLERVLAERSRTPVEAAAIRRAALAECAGIARKYRSEAELKRHQELPGEVKACWLWAFDTSNAIERDIRALADRPPAQPVDDGWRSDMEAAPKRYRHQKRGSTYQVIADDAEVQVASGVGIDEAEIVVVYRAESDGSYWVRRRPEFYDGRFELLPAPPAPETPDGK